MNPNPVLEAIRRRRSIRHYTDEPIAEETLQQILEAGLIAPSSRAIRPCEFILVTDRDTLKAMAGFRDTSAQMLSEATAAIVVLADRTKSDVWAEDASIAMAYMHLAADALGLASCWVQGRLRTAGPESSEAYLRRLLHYPESYALEAVLALGHATYRPKPREVTPELRAKIHRERF